jgi:class 3 adenylate cyclase
MDFFGTTVNMAARLEGKAKPGQVVMTAELAADETVASVLSGRSTSTLTVRLKGIVEEQRLVSVATQRG